MSDEVDFICTVKVVRARIPGGCCVWFTPTSLSILVSWRLARKVRRASDRARPAGARSKTIAELFLPRVQEAIRKRYSGSGVAA